MAWNVSDDLEICQIAWKVPKCTGQFSNSFNRGRKETIEKVSRWPEKLQMVWTISRWPGMFSDGWTTPHTHLVGNGQNLLDPPSSPRQPSSAFG